jgi:hypothetical protein
MSTEPTIHDSIDDAAATVGSVWPLHSFVTANPLSGFEDQPFQQAVTEAADLLGGRGYPTPETFRMAINHGQIDREILAETLVDHGYEADPETLLDRMAAAADRNDDDPDTVVDRVDHILTKWLSAFLDEGRAHWPLPNREAGFYTVFREVAAHDREIPETGVLADLPETPIETIETVVDSHPAEESRAIFAEQLAALPGWTGFIKQRTDDGGAWQSAHPISVEGYLAARLALLDAFDADITPDPGSPESSEADELAEAFLSAWESTYRTALVEPPGRTAGLLYRHALGDHPPPHRGHRRVRDPRLRWLFRNPDAIQGVRRGGGCRCVSTDPRPTAPNQRLPDRRRDPVGPRPPQWDPRGRSRDRRDAPGERRDRLRLRRERRQRLRARARRAHPGARTRLRSARQNRPARARRPRVL